jgi:DNA helicase-2/ATP-dependent DNA helicase PcrA
MVDEYQDTNKLQAEITYLLSKDYKNIMVVGDDAQSIYGFRGASHENIMEFPKYFPDCKIIKLEVNYRSHQQILNVANAILKNMKNKFSKSLISAGKRYGEKPQLMFFRDGYEEANWIAGKIKEFRDAGIPLSHQAVLFRSSYISLPLQVELSKKNIPFQVFGGIKFYETAHVKDILGHLKVIVNFKDELSWNRILMLVEGIGPKTSERIIQGINRCTSFKEIIYKSLGVKIKDHKYSKDLKRLGKVLDKISNKGMKTKERFDFLMNYYFPILREKFDDWQQRKNDLEALKQISARYLSLNDFLADFAIEPPELGVSRVETAVNADERPLTLSTIHSAKGLEWDCVFLIGLIDGVLPVSFSLNDDEEVEEEHRLFYVGVTRAKKHLFLSVHHEGNGFGLSQFNRISRFLDSPNVLAKLEQKVCVSRKDYDW